MAEVTLTKKGLKSREVKECITSNINYPSVNDDVTKAVQAVVQYTTSREKFGNSGSSDRRFSASDKLTQEGYVTPTKPGPKGPEQEFVEKSKECLREIFCTKRRDLLRELQLEGKISKMYSVDDNGLLSDHNITMTEADVCKLIEKAADSYMDDISLEQNTPSITGNKRDRDFLETVTRICNDTLIALLQFDLATSHNLMTDEGVFSWRNQVREIACFGKLMTILEIYHIKKGASFYKKD